MEQLHRALRLHHLLNGCRVPIAAATLCEQLECSASTFKRLLGLLRDRFHAPITYDRSGNGYRYDNSDGHYSLPGLWFNESELYALLMAEQLFEDVTPGVIGTSIAALKQQVQELLGIQRTPDAAAMVRIATVARQPLLPQVFTAVIQALTQRHQLQVNYTNAQGAQKQRMLSPQQLCWYRDNWYLVAWCHLRNELLLFMLSRMASAAITREPAIALEPALLSGFFNDSYGIFAGEATATAELKFAASAAPWVQPVQWHPQQQMTIASDGAIHLKLPYHDDRELVRDILRFGTEVEVLSPPELRAKVATTLAEAAKKYAGK